MSDTRPSLALHLGVLALAAERHPADAVSARAVDLGQSTERSAERVSTQRRHRHELHVRIDHLVVYLIAEHDESAFLGDSRDTFQALP